MTMHMVHPSLSMSGKRKGKFKFKNAADAARHRELASDWKELQQKWAPSDVAKKITKINTSSTYGKSDDSYNPPVQNIRTTNNHIPSRDTGYVGAISSKPTQQYTGTKMLGIGTLHKSNSVPIFTDEEAIDIAKMRR